MGIRRWASYDERGYYSDSSLVDHELGDWVKYNDHIKIIDNYLEEIHNLELIINKYTAVERPWDSITGEDYND